MMGFLVGALPRQRDDFNYSYVPREYLIVNFAIDARWKIVNDETESTDAIERVPPLPEINMEGHAPSWPDNGNGRVSIK